MKHFFTILILIATHLTVSAQTININGIVNGEGTHITNANITVFHIGENRAYFTTHTDPLGHFKISANKTDIIQVSHIGYITYRFSVKGDSSITIKLSKDKFNLAEVGVNASKPLIEQQFDRTVIHVDGESKAGINAVDIMRKLPGVLITNGNEIRFEGKSIMVNIDDKATRLSGNDLINLLNATSSRNISKIELLYNPSAKFDAQGEGGILNIKSFKRSKPGYDANISLTGGHGWKYSTGNNISASLNYRSNKDYFYGSYSISAGKQYQEIQTATRLSNIRQSLLDSTIFASPYRNQNVRVGYDHYFTKKSVFGTLFTGYYNFSDPLRETSTQIFSNSSLNTDSTRKSNNNNDRLSKGANLNLNYKLTIDSAKQQEISIDVDGGIFSYDDNNLLSMNLLNPNGISIMVPLNLLQNGNTLTKIISYKTDYTQKIKKATIESGIKASYVDIANDFRSNRTSNNLTTDNGSNNFSYKETILSAYVSGKFEMGKFTIQPGLRLEQTSTNCYSLTLDSIFKRNYLSLFPNLAMGYKTKNHSISASYSRRIGRPNYSYLNPFRLIRSAYSIVEGNPYLLPSFTENFRLGYTYMGKWTFSVSFRNAKDVITDLSRVDDVSKVTIDTKSNLAENKTYAANLGYYDKLFKIWSIGLSVGLSNSEYLFGYQNTAVTIKQTSFSYSVDNRLTLKNTWWLSAFLYGQTRVTYGNQINLPISYLNLGVGKNILKGKATLSLSLNDVFYGSITRSETRYGNVDYDLKSKYDSRNVRLNFIYNFGNTQVRVRKRLSGSSEEQGRSN
jgi:hypothetical protein